jgi:hypothetical protein
VVNEQTSSFFRSPARKKLEQIHDFNQQSENLHFSSSVSWWLDDEVRFHPCSGFLALKPAKLVGLPPQTQSPEHIAHGAESRRPGILNRWRLLAVCPTLALLLAHMMEISRSAEIESEVVIGARAGAIECAAISDGKIR